MSAELFLILGQIGVIAVLGALGALILRQKISMTWFVIALLLYIVNDVLLTRALFTIPNVFPNADWNWLGKLLALAGTLAVAALPSFGFSRSGLTLRHQPNSQSAIMVFAILTIVIFYFAITTGDGPDNIETIAFQWTMPGLEEEIFYRGVLLLAMNEAFRAKAPILGAPIGYGGLLTCILFGLGHAMDFSNGSYSFDTITFIVTGGPSLILLWIREKTGSLLLPIIAHNVANGAFTLF